MPDKIPWHDDDAFWELFEPFLFSAKGWQRAVEKAGSLVELLGLKPGDSVLDLCCGPGRFVIELARRGFAVTGVDRTARYLDSAREKLKETGVEAELVHADMREFLRPRSFDVCINMFSSFGYFDDKNDDRKVAENVFRSLKSGGRFVIETMARETLFHIFQGRGWEEADDGTLVLHERKPNDDWSWLSQRWILVKNGQQSEHTVWMRIYSASELMGLLEEVGFEKAGIYGNVEGAPYNKVTSHMTLVARKPV